MVCLGKEEIRITQGSGIERAADISETSPRSNDVLHFRHYAELPRANAEINFRNGGSAEGSLARRGGRPIPRKGWDPFFPPRLGLPTEHSQRPLKGMGPLLPIRAPALSQAILKEWLGRRPGRNGLSAVSSAEGQGLWTLAFASSWQTGHFASAIWKFLSAFALAFRWPSMQQRGAIR